MSNFKLFKPAKNEMAFLKAGIYGEAGSGKTRTASEIAIGLYHHTKSDKPVAFIDTETGSDFVLPLFNQYKVPLVTLKRKAFADLLPAIREAVKYCSTLILDSITHPWRELLDSYCKALEIESPRLRDWVPIKKTWGEFSELYTTSPLHFIMCGRAGFVWDDVEDEAGVKELKKVGTKMKTETETGHEPSLLIEMERYRQSAKVGGGWINRAWIVKDRFDVMNGKSIKMPTFESFLPHIELLNLGGKHHAIDEGRSSKDMFQKGETGADFYRKREILIEKIKSEIHLCYPTANATDKSNRLKLMDSAFGTKSFKELENMKNLQPLKQGLKKLEVLAKEMENE